MKRARTSSDGYQSIHRELELELEHARAATKEQEQAKMLALQRAEAKLARAAEAENDLRATAESGELEFVQTKHSFETKIRQLESENANLRDALGDIHTESENAVRVVRAEVRAASERERNRSEELVDVKLKLKGALQRMASAVNEETENQAVNVECDRLRSENATLRAEKEDLNLQIEALSQGATVSDRIRGLSGKLAEACRAETSVQARGRSAGDRADEVPKR